MIVTNVRLGCRRRIGIHCQQQPFRRAGFVSFGELADSSLCDETTTNERRAIEGFHLDLEENARKRPPLSVPWRHKLPRPYGVDRKLENLFSATQQQRDKGQNLRYSGGPVSENTALESLSDMLNEGKATPEAMWAQFEEVIRTNAWKSTRLHIIDEVDLKLKKAIFRELLLQICEVRSREPFRQSIPSPATVIRIYVKHGLMEYWWEKILWLQLGAMIDLGRGTFYKIRTGDIPAHENINQSAASILEVWEVFMEVHGNRISSSNSQILGHDPPNVSNCDTSMLATMSTSQRVSTGWRGLPTSADIKFRSVRAPKEKLHRFLHYLPNHPNVRETIRVAEAAVLTRDYIQFSARRHLISEAMVEFAQPFLELMEHIFEGQRLHTTLAILCLGEQGVTPGTARDVLRRWSLNPRVTELPDASNHNLSALRKELFASEKASSISEEASSASEKASSASEKNPSASEEVSTASENVSTASEEVSSASKEASSALCKPRFAHVELKWKKKRYEVFSKKIGRALEKCDPSYLADLWHTFQSMPVLNEPEEPALEALYLHYIVAFFSLRQSDQATEVWNYMIKSGLSPNLKHWNAMLAGSATSKDILSLQGIWSNLKAAGFEPDAYAWTTWIHGLMRCGEWQQGLQALEELGEVWKKTTSSDAIPVANDFQPPVLSIIPINAAISGCYGLHKPELIPHILQWAESQNVPLETSTFNIMLKPLVYEDDHTATDALISSMQRHGCAPDIITVTVILNRLLHGPNSAFLKLSPTAQHDAILTILRKMEQQGLPATVKTYCTILDGLLRPGKANIFAAHAVLSHMANKNLKPSSSIYTILATHYFEMRPPDLAAVDTLWQRIRSDGGIRDHYFFDRMIEGYARFSRVEKMLAMLRDALTEGKTPSWLALTAIVNALKRAREWATLTDIVTDVLDEENGILRHGEVEPSGKGHFWAVVDQLVEDGYIQVRIPNQETAAEF